MTARTRLSFAVTVALGAGAGACRTVPPAVAPPPPHDLIVLTTNPDDGALGAATVTTPHGSASLTRAGEGVQVQLESGPGAPQIVPADDLQRIFGDALGVMPPPATRYLLYFEVGSDTLTPESRALVPEILATVQTRTSPDVSIIGHTDSTGGAAANVALGLRRAAVVRELLVGAGLDSAVVDVASHGESNPVVPMPDNTAEARNRRVEVTVR